MLGARFCIRPTSALGIMADDKNSSLSCSPASPSSFRCSIRSNLRPFPCRPSSKSLLICCDSSHGSFSSRSRRGDNQDHEYLEASLLIPETTLHYQMRRQGFRGESVWQASRQLPPFSVRASESKVSISSIGLGFLRRFQNPTIFLKISCDGDFLLPIIVGDVAVAKLIDALDDNVECPDQYQFLSDVVEKLGYDVKMVKITERVVNTYHAKLCLGKQGKSDVISVDARPSDAINVAKACKASIYVNKEIVLEDAIRIGYGGRQHGTKPIHDVILDSAPEGPDPLSEELTLVRNMNLATEEERYDDAAMWRDKLKKLREST